MFILFKKFPIVIFVKIVVLFILFHSNIQSRPIIYKGEFNRGAGKIYIQDKVAHPDKTMRIFYYWPRIAQQDTPIVIVMHGVNRDAKNNRDKFIDEAIKYNFILVAPEFKKKDFPNRFYHGGNIRNKKGQVLEKKWSYTIIDNIFNLIQKQTNNSNKNYILMGHSAGGQFVHRMLLFRPYSNFSIAVAANAGYYTFPDLDQDFIFGLRRTHATRQTLTRALNKRMLLLLGEQDNDPKHKHLPRSKGAMAQGAHRLERGNNFYNFAKQAANQLRVKFNWEKIVVKHTGHSGSKTLGHAMSVIFNESPKATEQNDRKLNPGEGRFIYSDHTTGWKIPVWYYKPQNISQNAPVIFLTHGSDRDARYYRDNRIRYANDYQFILVAPEFDRAQFTDHEYFRGNVFKKPKGTMRNQNEWTFTVLDRIFEHIQNIGNPGSKYYYIFGNTGSAHFPLRMTMLYPYSKARFIAIANPLYSPEYDQDTSFPNSLKNARLGNQHLQSVFQKNILVLAGSRGRNYKVEDRKDKTQGKYLYDRSLYFYENAKKKSSEIKSPFYWKFKEVKGTRWSYTTMFKAALKAWGFSS